jgi:hypothetical protein
MSSLGEIQSATMSILKKINLNRNGKIKTCSVIFPENIQPKILENRKFLIECFTSSVDDEMLKNTDYTFTEESMRFTLYFKDIKVTKDSKNQIAMPFDGFKTSNCYIYYNKKKYGIEFEKTSEFDNKTVLYCNIKK